jgi:exodeoxyribonuclease V gamma subunit
MLRVICSNRLELLAEHLAASVVAAPADSLFAPETVLVERQAMARWLSLRLASRLGVCANFRFLFPERFIWEVFQAYLPDLQTTSPVAPPILTWRLFAALATLEKAPAFAPVRDYLRDGDERKRHVLAAHVAIAFNDYLVYRPDWIRQWEAGKEEHWQANLWRFIAASIDNRHWAAAQQAFFEVLANNAASYPEPLPRRVSVFAVSALPPSYLQVLERLAGCIEVQLLVLTPCCFHWTPVGVQPAADSFHGGVHPGTVSLDLGNPLLASWAKQINDFLAELQQRVAEVEWLPVQPEPQTLLGALQADMLERRPRAKPRGKRRVAPDDRSLQIHVCHGPMREVEVLHDQLLAMFEAYPDLSPSDVVVMAPDIEPYASLVEAVFA